MMSKVKTLFSVISILAFLGGCAKVEYTNIIDPKSEDYVGDDASADDDGNGIANIFDPGSPYFPRDTVPPVITILGDNPATLYYNESRKETFKKEIEDLKKQFDCKDEFQRSLGKDKVDVEDRVGHAKGDWEIVYSVYDSSGNFTRVSRKVIVVEIAEADVTPPSIVPGWGVVNDTVTIVKGTPIDDYMEYIYVHDQDQSKFELGKNIKKEGDVNVNKAAVYKVKYTATDSSDNSASYTLYFHVIDEGGDITNAVLRVFYDKKEKKHGDILKDTIPDVTIDKDLFTWNAYEYVNGDSIDLHDKVVSEYDVKTNKEGNYTADFSVRGSNGIEKRIVIYIQIINLSTVSCSTTVEVSLVGDAEIIREINERYEDPGVEAFLFPGKKDISNTVVINPDPKNIKTTKDTTYIITYTVKNTCGEATTLTRKLIVKSMKDTVPPVIKIKSARQNDTVLVGSKYGSLPSTLKQPRDVIESIVDDKDGNITIPTSFSSTGLSIDTTGFRTTSAGVACSVVYKIKDKAGIEGKAVRKFVVVDASTLGLLKKYGVQTAGPLPSINKTFAKLTVEGSGGPSSTIVSNVRDLKLSWQQGNVNDFALNLKNGNPNYFSLRSTSQTFSSSSPTLTISSSSGLPAGFAGKYYVVYTDSKFVWVQEDGNYALVWEE